MSGSDWGLSRLQRLTESLEASSQSLSSLRTLVRHAQVDPRGDRRSRLSEVVGRLLDAQSGLRATVASFRPKGVPAPNASQDLPVASVVQDADPGVVQVPRSVDRAGEAVSGLPPVPTVSIPVSDLPGEASVDQAPAPGWLLDPHDLNHGADLPLHKDAVSDGGLRFQVDAGDPVQSGSGSTEGQSVVFPVDLDLPGPASAADHPVSNSIHMPREDPVALGLGSGDPGGRFPSITASPVDNEMVDPELVDLILLESDDLIPQISDYLDLGRGGDHSIMDPLHHALHTLKGSLGMGGLLKARALIHAMETDLQDPPSDLSAWDRGRDMLAEVSERLRVLRSPSQPVQDPLVGASPPMPDPVSQVQAPVSRTVRVSVEDIDRLSAEANEARIAYLGLAALMVRQRAAFRELHAVMQRQSRLQKELEMYAESQIQSRRLQLHELGQDFDPLELDRFTRQQEFSRAMSETVSDGADIYRDLLVMSSEGEALLAEQEVSISEIDEGVRKTRLVPADSLRGRLSKVVGSTASEVGKQCELVIRGGANRVDRTILDRILSPLEHLMRNAVAHGIEDPQVRASRGKPAKGQIELSFFQDAGRLTVTVSDDGAGVDPERVRQRAVDRGLWDPSRPMDANEAAEMICVPGFSTAAQISQIAGRGVGMDVVRAEVLGMGGRFTISSVPGNGLTVTVQLPLVVASLNVVVVESSGEPFAVPVEMIAHIGKISPADLDGIRAQSGFPVTDVDCVEPISGVVPHVQLSSLGGLPDLSPVGLGSAYLVVREGERKIAIGVDRVVGVEDLPLRALGSMWSGVPGIMGGVFLRDDRIAFLVDPLRMRPSEAVTLRRASRQSRTVMVVDDSITVRKASQMFLERNGFTALMARDGREALEILATREPMAILMDVEMPRMDGFDCASNIKENPKLAHIPIAMVTSRTAEKHRARAAQIGVEAYFGKPFNEGEVMAWLSSLDPVSDSRVAV